MLNVSLILASAIFHLCACHSLSFFSHIALKVEPNRTYSQTVDSTFRISNAALSAHLPAGAKRTSVIITNDEKEFTLCNLIPTHAESAAVDITFETGEEITISSIGNAPVDLTGNYVFEEDDEDMFGDEDDEGG